MRNDDQEFEEIIKGNGMNYNNEQDSGPYGTPAATQKPGLTKRGKIALGIGAVVIGGGSLIGYQAHSANMAEQETKAQEIALKMKALELEELKERNEIAVSNRKELTKAANDRQANVNECVKASVDQVAKQQWATSRSDLIDACQTQYQTSIDGTDMSNVGSAEEAGDGSGSVNSTGLLIAGVALAGVLAYGARRGSRASAE